MSLRVVVGRIAKPALALQQLDENEQRAASATVLFARIYFRRQVTRLKP